MIRSPAAAASTHASNHELRVINDNAITLTPTQAGGRHRFRHGEDCAADDPLITADPWNCVRVQFSPAIMEVKQRSLAMQLHWIDVTMFPSTLGGQFTNPDLIAK